MFKNVPRVHEIKTLLVELERMGTAPPAERQEARARLLAHPDVAAPVLASVLRRGRTRWQTEILPWLDSIPQLTERRDRQLRLERSALEVLQRMAMVRNPAESAAEDEKRPSRVKVVWAGGLPPFEGVIESVGTKYTMFSDKGFPVRATCTVKIKEASRASFKKGT